MEGLRMGFSDVAYLATGPAAAMAWVPFMCFIGIGLALLLGRRSQSANDG